MTLSPGFRNAEPSAGSQEAEFFIWARERGRILGPTSNWNSSRIVANLRANRMLRLAADKRNRVRTRVPHLSSGRRTLGSGDSDHAMRKLAGFLPGGSLPQLKPGVTVVAAAMTAAGPEAVAADSMAAGYSAAAEVVDRRAAAGSLSARQADPDLHWAARCCCSVAPRWAETLRPLAADLLAEAE